MTISLLIVSILAIVVFAAYRQVDATLVRASGDRAQAAARQISGLLETQRRQAGNQIRGVAADSALRRFLKTRAAEDKAAAEKALAPLVVAGPRHVSLWDNTGIRLIHIVVPAAPGSAAPGPLPDSTPPMADGLTPLQRMENGVYSDSSASVADADPALSKLGYVSLRTTIYVNPPGLLGNLVGTDARIEMGNRDGSLWVDLSNSTPAAGPSIDTSEDGIAEYRGNDGTRKVGGLAGIRDTPWTIWVEFPEHVVAAPAREFLEWMIALGVIFALAGALLVRLLTAGVTRPLEKMTQAAESIAAGDYSRRVDEGRHDELGRLARAFDAMTDKVSHDIMERERVATALRENEDRLRYTLATAGVGTWQMDLPSNNLDWSDTMAPLFGLTVADLPTTREGMLALVHPDDRTEVRAFLERAASDDAEHQIYFRALQPNEEIKWIVGRSRALSDGAGGARMLGVCFDVTEQRLLEDRLRQAQKMDAIGKLAGGVAHDFNNLLTAILGFGTFVLDSLDETDARRVHVQEILKAGRRASDLTAQLLAFSRQQLLQPVVVDLNALVIDTTQLLRRLIGEDIQLETLLTPGPATVRADPVQMQQIVMNLAINARDAMREGGRLTIETATVELDAAWSQHFAVAPGSYVVLAVTDTGSGMSTEVRSRLFEPFFTTKERGQGTGLGLATVYGAVKQAGGYIWVYSEPGQGSAFKVYLPVAAGPAQAAEPAAPAEAPAAGSETILLVEDEEAVRLLATTILKRAGYRVVEAANAVEAEAKHLQHAGVIKLLVTDVVLPGSSGPELFQRITLRDAGLKVIYMSGYTDDAVFRTGRLQEGTAFIQKPFTADGLRRKVREVLDAA